MVAVLLSPARVAARRLDVPAGLRADPDVSPGGWNGQAADPGQLFGVAHHAPIHIQDLELLDPTIALPQLLPGAPTPQPRLRIVDVAQSGRARSRHRIIRLDQSVGKRAQGG